MPLSFNLTLQVFAPKGDRERDKIEVVRSPGETRPLGLKDYGNKIIGTTWARAFAPVLRAGACPLQRGFVPGRQLVQNPVDLDAAARAFGRSRAAHKWPL